MTTTLFKDKKNGSGGIFDSLEDIFDKIEVPTLKKYVEPPKVSLRLTDEIRNMIRSEISAILREEVAKAVSGIKPRTIETKTIERVIEKPIETIREVLDEIKLKKTIETEIKKAKEDIEKDGKLNVFIPAPVGIPNMSGQSEKVLSNDGNQTKWIVQSGGASGSSESYTTSNVTTRRTLDANDTSLDELADIVASLIVDFQAAGLLQ
jgi:predicted RND superfamily exporter protein